MFIQSETTGLSYDDMDMVFFKNYIQAAHYISWGARLWDIFVTGDMKLCFVFSKEDHSRLKSRWGTRENNGRNVDEK